ncbi:MULTISPECIES: SDR family NAD(P)-dependent oxidoreductase [Kitasatospora]|uniref:SDR family NAD(P)-dependent oxidoreductase n=1 Tax=Kitasatospora TaxID=2063 RepID=UPI0031DFD782
MDTADDSPNPADGQEGDTDFDSQEIRLAVVLVGDVTNGRDAARLVRETVERFGTLDVAVNNAGVLGAFGPAADVDEDEWRRVIEVDLTGTWLAMKYQIGHMRTHGGGAIVNIASNLGSDIRAGGMV